MKKTLLLCLILSSFSTFAQSEKESCISVVIDEIDATAVGQAANLKLQRGERDEVVDLYKKIGEIAITTCEAFGAK